jgi:hypothetical protein
MEPGWVAPARPPVVRSSLLTLGTDLGIQTEAVVLLDICPHALLRGSTGESWLVREKLPKFGTQHRRRPARLSLRALFHSQQSKQTARANSRDNSALQQSIW